MNATRRPQNFQSLVGQRFERLVVVAEPGSGPNRVVTVRCDCGCEKDVLAVNLKTGRTKSCGCLHNKLMTKHGKSHTPEYFAWKGMIRRCTKPSDRMWKHYGGRGINVCQHWLESFESFLADMGPRPAGCSLDRIDNDGSYEPGNCRWATATVQRNNSRQNHFLTINGVTRTLAEWARQYGINPKTLRGRLWRGVDPSKALGITK